MTCTSHPWGAADGMACTRTDAHDAGHVYEAAWLGDHHDASEARATEAVDS